MPKLTRREMLRLMSYSMAGLALAGCAQTATPEVDEDVSDADAQPEPTEVPPSAEPIVITWIEGLAGRFSASKENRDEVYAAMSARMQDEGLNIEVRSLWLDDWNGEFPLKFIEPQVTCGFNAGWAHMNSLRDQGALVAVEELIEEYGPAIKEAYGKENLEVNTHSDGHLYGLPAVYNYGGTYGIVLRDDLRKKYDAPMPTSEEGWPSILPFLEAIKENEPDLIPMAVPAGGSYVGYSEETERARDTGLGFVIPDEMGDLTYIAEEEWGPGKEGYEFARMLAEEGLINQNPIQDFEEELFSWLAAGKAASLKWHEPEGRPAYIRPLMKDTFPEAEVTGVDLSGMRDGRYKPCAKLKSWNWAIFNSSAPEEEVIAAMQWRNWIVSSQENCDLWLLGIGGVHHNMEPDMKYSTPDGVDEATNYFRRWFNGAVPGTMERQALDADPDEVAMWNHISDLSNFETCGLASYTESSEIKDRYNAEMSAIQDERVTFIQGLHFGNYEDVDATFEEMGETFDQIGRQDVMAAYQADLNDWLAQNK